MTRTSTPGSDWSSPPPLTSTVVNEELTASVRKRWKNVYHGQRLHDRRHHAVSITIYMIGWTLGYDVHTCRSARLANSSR